MKKIANIFLILISTLLLQSCEDTYLPPALDYVTFETNPLKLVVNKNESNNIDVSLYTTEISSSDRIIGIYVDIDQTTADAAAYTLPTTVTIPANTNAGTFNINVTDTNLSESGEVLVVNFEMEDGLYTSGAFSLNIELFCPLNLDDFVGLWEGTTSYGYPTQVETSINASGQLEITGIGVGFMENDWGEVIDDMATLVMDVDLETGDFTIAEAYYMTTTYNGAVQAPYNLSAVGNLNACAGAMYLDYDFIQGGTSFTEWLTIGNGYPPFVEDIQIK